jgi:hypothetical protein
MEEQQTATTIPPMYGPFAEFQFEEMKQVSSQITTRIPEDKMAQIWDWYLRINSLQEPKPCGCQSAAGLWIKALDSVRKFIAENDK